LGYQALRLGKRLGVPVVSSFHTRYETYFKYYAGLNLAALPFRHYQRFFYRSCRNVYVPSESMMEALAEQGISGNVSLWRRGVDSERFNPSK
ncbi:glycosyltransferase, partial [Acinetobacter baumannii]